MIVAMVLMFVGNACKEHWIVYVRSLQLIIIMPMMNVPIPSNIIDFLQTISDIAFYDIFDKFNIWSYFTFLKFNQDINVPFINQQMQTISFNVRNTFLGIGSASVYLLAYLFQVVLAVFLKLFIMITGEKFIKKNILRKVLKELFFNSILSMSMEGYIEFLVYGILNICTRDTSTNGEILGIIFAFFCIFLASLFLPSALVGVIYSKDEA